MKRGYPVDTLLDAIKQVSHKTRETLLEIEWKKWGEPELTWDEHSQDLFLITTYTPEYMGLKTIVRENWDLLKWSSTTKNLAESRVIVGYRWRPNLKDILVRAKVPKLVSKPMNRPHCSYANKCSNKKCQFCPLLDKSGRILSSFTKREYECKKNITCKSSNLIYCITCKRCSQQYVGQTGNTLHKRFGAHAGFINQQNLKEDIGRHFNIEDHHWLSDMIIHILDFIHAPPKSQHGLTLWLQIEFNWIQRLRTMLPMGLNTNDRTPQS